ncbi:hypothetical protein CIPAW_15G081300 [Carya illinoinensis]|uniref:Uncharacterized protein n=1 Tax=Carya illinoinensis TaxID=32201 RepID=A0A8T1N590_CARIL|nr:hypothetical protein CIPAW_15G081300 [Carya illinoinensis]
MRICRRLLLNISWQLWMNATKAQDWYSKQKDYDDKRDPYAVFNVLDTMLKDSFERLKTMRQSISLPDVGFQECTLEVNYAKHVHVIRDLCLVGKEGAARSMGSKKNDK